MYYDRISRTYTSFFFNLEAVMSLKNYDYRNNCAMLNAEETNEAQMIEKIAECMIDQSLKFDDQLRIVTRNDFAEEE